MLSVQTPAVFSSPPSRTQTPVKRIPLQELPTSPAGTLIGSRTPTERPYPSADKENLHAIINALETRANVISQHARRLSNALSQVRDRRLRLENTLRDAIQHTAANHHPAPHMSAHPRLSLSLDSDGGGEEQDLSLLALAHAAAEMEQADQTFEDEVMSQGFEAEDTSVEDEAVEEGENEQSQEEEEEVEEEVPLVDPASLGLKEISNLGKFTVSSHKQGSGVDELRSDDLKLYWQYVRRSSPCQSTNSGRSDGPQPHRLTVYFVKRVGIRDIRFFVDYSEDESYTPTKIVFKSGTSENNLIEFASMTMDSPVGWQQVPIEGAGGDPDGNTLVSYVLQMQILENHQNGKDTHLRGIKIYAFDNESAQGPGRESNPVDDVVGLVGDAAARQRGVSEELGGLTRTLAATSLGGEGGFTIPDFMREPELR